MCVMFNRRLLADALAVSCAVLCILVAQPAESDLHQGSDPLAGVRKTPSVHSTERSVSQVQLLRCDEHAVEVELLTPGFGTALEKAEGRMYHRISLPEAGLTQEEGAPQLPVRTVTLGIPLDVEVRAEVILTETEEVSGIEVYPAPRNVIRQRSSGEPFTDVEFYRDEQRYGHSALYPASIVDVGPAAFIRGQRVVQVEVYPLQANPSTGKLFHHRRIIFRLTFLGAEKEDWWDSGGLMSVPGSDGPFEAVLKNILLNYEFSRAWRQERAALAMPKAAGTQTPYSDSTAYKIAIAEDGLYSMSYEYLQGKGVAVSHLDPKTVKMYGSGRQIPIYVSGARDGRFDPGDAIQFWGEMNYGDVHYFDPYTHTNVYWLNWGGNIGLRMVEQDGSLMEEDADSLYVPDSYRTSIHLEQDLNYERLSQISDETVDRWLWEEINADTTRNYAFNLPAVIDTAQCEVSVRLRGITFPSTRPNHHTKIWLNGNLLASEYWNDQSEYVYHRDDLPGTYLWNGDNLLRIENVGDTGAGDVDKIRVNSMQIDCWRRYQAVGNFLKCATPEGGPLGLYEFHLERFTTPDIEIFDLAGKKIVNADVSPDSIFYTVRFQDHVVRPAEYVALPRNLMKLPDDVVPNQVSNLHAVSNAADHIIIVHSDFYQSIQPLASHRQSQGLRVKVVRVEDIYDEFNDGVLDPEAIREFLQYAYQHWTAPAPASVLLVGDTSWGYDKPITHKSYWLEDCYVPTMMAWTSAWGTSAADNRLVCLVGNDRLPDMSVGRFPVSSVNKANVLVDKVIQYEANPEIGPWRKRIQLLAGEGATFERGCVELDSAFVPPGYDVPRIYTKSGSAHFGTTQDLLNQWDEGVAMATFTGHGGGSVWFDANFFLLEHVPLLNNGRRLPLVLSLTCFVGYFDNPWNSSLGEEILRAENKGAVAHFGSSGVAWANEDNLLGQNIYEAIFSDGLRDIGMIATQGKLGQRRISQELVDVFNLLGDPATRIGLPAQEISLNLTESSLPIGSTISCSGNIPGSPSGTVEVSFGDVDSTGWMINDTMINTYDKIFSPRIPVVQDTITASGGGFSWQVTPPDTLPEYPLYQPTSGKKTMRAYFWNNQTDAIGWPPVYVDIPYINNIHHQPERPMAWQDIHILADVALGSGLDADGPDTVKVKWGLRQGMLYNSVLMMSQGGSAYRTAQPIYAQGGAYIYYQIVVKYGGVAGSPSTQSYSSSVRSLQVARFPNLWVAKRDLTVFVQNNQLMVGSWIHNTGVLDLDSVLVQFFDDHPDLHQQIGSDLRIVVPSDDSTFVSVPWDGPGESHDIWVWVDPHGDVEQAFTYDDRVHREFSNLFLVTPVGGSLVDGITSRVCHTGGNFGCRIEPGAVNLSSLLFIDDQRANSAYYAAEYDPAEYQQPGLSFALLQDSSQAAYGLTWGDSSATLNATGADIYFWYDPQDSVTSSAIQMGQLKICRFVEDISRWVLLPEQETVVDSSMVHAQTDQLSIFSLFSLVDEKAPLVRINVEGQSFANGDYISSNPVISAAIEDENGVDLSTGAIEVTLNGDLLGSGEYSVGYSPQTSNLSLLTFVPILSPGAYAFKVKVQDCCGNTAVDSIAFNVTAGFQVPFVANHPNPFQTETVFAFVVASDAPAEQVALKIYTVRGRLIREFSRRSVGPGYVEIVWDGRDQDGEVVANGVYYYKMSITGDNGEKITPIVGKMAKLQ